MLLRKRYRARKQRTSQVSIKRNLLYGFFVILAVIIVCMSVWYSTRLSVFTISTVHIQGGETVSHELIREIVEHELTGSYILLVPYRFSYLYPRERIIMRVNDVSRVHSANVERHSRTEIEVSFSEYVPHALWCLTESVGAPCYFITREGYAFAHAPQLVGGTMTRHIFEGVAELEKRHIIDANAIERIDTFIQRIEMTLGLRVRDVIHTKDSDERYMINGGGAIYLASDTDMDKAFDNLKSIFDSKEFKKLEPGNFNYIDLRFGNKIFVNDKMSTSTSELENITTE